MARRNLSWHFIKEGEHMNRQLSEDPALSFDEDAGVESAYEDREAFKRHAALLNNGPGDHEDILHPLREAANRVGREVERFAEVLDGYNPRRATNDDEQHDVATGLINLYFEITSETLELLRERHMGRQEDESGERPALQSSTEEETDETTTEDMQRWEQETRVWDLLRRLVNLRFPHPQHDHDTRVPKQDVDLKYASETDMWNSFLSSDDVALERDTVLQWLKDTADQTGEDIDLLVERAQKSAGESDTIAQGWLYTRQAIKSQKRIHTWNHPLEPTSADVQQVHLNKERTQLLVTQLDPDAPFRQSRTLETQDQHYERAIWLGCYELLRRGKSATKIREWCNERAETWRAVSILGLPFDNDGEGDTAGDAASIMLWRRTCFALAHQAGGDEYQRAVYGLLCGDVVSVQPVCRNWNDHVFLHYNALVKSQYDQYLQSTYPGVTGIKDSLKLDAIDTAYSYGDPASAAKTIIDQLRNDPRTQQETCEPMKMLQGVLIADDFKDFIYNQGLALSKTANINEASTLIPARSEQPRDHDVIEYVSLMDHANLRVLVHVLLIFRTLGMDLGGFAREIEVENVIVAYISFLRLAGKEELIPLYASQLTGARRYAVLSRNLIDITDHTQRLTQIRLMRELGLDVQHFVKMQSRFLLDDHPDMATNYPATEKFKLFTSDSAIKSSKWKLRRDFLGEDDENPERVDMLLIRSLEWYLLVDGLWTETFNFGTMLYMRFYKHMHLLSARVLASRITADQIAQNKTKALLGESIRYDILASGIEAMISVSDENVNLKRLLKKHMFEEARSFRELEALAEHLDNVETISSHAFIIEEPGFEWPADYKRELAKMFPAIKSTAQVLLDGWLLASRKEAMANEFQQLREAYLPDAIMAYIEILQFGGVMLTRDFLLEVLDLAPKIANERSDLLDLFTKTGRMQDLVTSFARVSKTLVVVSSERKHRDGQTRKMKSTGFNYDIWNVVRPTT